MAIILPVITGLVCMLSFYLMLRDMEEQRKEKLSDPPDLQAEAAGMPRSTLIYSLVCVVLTVLIAVFFQRMYPDNSPWVNVKRMVLLAVMWPVAYIDFKTLRIPNLFIIFGLVCRGVILVFELLLGNPYVWPSLISEGIASVALLLAAVLCAVCVKNGIGFGDMKLFVIMGLMLGLEGIWGAIFLALVVSFFIAAFVLISKKKTRKDAIPFGPALVIGTYLSVCLSGM